MRKSEEDMTTDKLFVPFETAQKGDRVQIRVGRLQEFGLLSARVVRVRKDGVVIVKLDDPRLAGYDEDGSWIDIARKS
jgi:hypothetical protein